MVYVEDTHQPNFDSKSGKCGDQACHPGANWVQDVRQKKDVESLVPWTAVGRSSDLLSSDGHRTASRRSSDGCRRSSCRQRRRKKKHLIEAAPFGRLDQMLRTTV